MSERGETLEEVAERLRELASLGAVWAATATEQLLGRTVLTHAPTVHGGLDLVPSGEWSTGLLFTTHGDFPGLVGVFVTPSTRCNVVRLLLGSPPGEPDAAAVESALREFGNIVVSQTLSAIANATGGRIEPSVPELVMENAAAVLATRLPSRRRGYPGLLVGTELFDRQGDLRALLVFAPDPKHL